ncbi:SH3 domain protein [Ophiocordyceps sinensis CO18]|uniref:SH3 domain protein n=1 Tax=Ophiocordyceps sinensis (strain Co18 / CGMCC 3.14243) TaxID=911162 RepID=T5AIT3_OPHSC|nr:SH3 domain protein [Ophiocordyceps sinensis CO18]
MAAPFRVKALYEYSSPHDDDLKFAAGQIITVTHQEDADWYEGEYLDDDGAKQQGIFPCNFVDKYEPTAPPRPARTRPKKDAEPAQPPPEDVAVPPPVAPARQDLASPSHEEPEMDEADAPARKSPPTEYVSAAAAVPGPSKPAESAPAPTPSAHTSNASESRGPPAAPPASATKRQPAAPPVSDKPSGNSFRDRIAAFNKPAALPIAPFKPSGLSGGGGSASFIKKPFVAPPPSRNAYVPPPRETPTTPIYRREEDPEIKEREAANLEQAEKAGLASTAQQSVGGEEAQPKPTSLKERIALLQKQQMEQAQRHAEAAAKKDKPKKPPKKVAEPSAEVDFATEAAVPHVPAPSSEHREVEDTGSRTSTDEVHAARAPLPPRRKPSKGPATELVHDSNDADMSGAGDTSEGQDDTTEREDSDETSRRTAQLPSTTMTPLAATLVTPSEAETEADEAEQDEEDVDPEVRRKEELRARMAKMSGGMGFHGMFGAPVPPTAMAPPKKKAPKAEAAAATEGAEDTSPISRAAPPIPTPMALPGMGTSRASEETKRAGQDEAALPSRAAPPSLPTRPVDDDGHHQLEDEDEEDEATTQAPMRESKGTLVAQRVKGRETEANNGAAPRRDVGGPPRVPGGRPAPPPVPVDGRPPPPPPPADIKSATEGSESDDELSARERNVSNVSAAARCSMPPHPSHAPGFPARSPPLSPRPEDSSPVSPSMPANRRNSRPPVPGSAPVPPPAHSRPPPPPPPGGSSREMKADGPPAPAVPTRPPQAGEEENEENTEYEGDYDTDIASSVPHKDALKAHARDSSLEDNGPQSPATDAPPIQARAEAYVPGSPSAASPPERRAPPAAPGARAPHRQSLEVGRTSMSGRRSIDIARPSMESGFIANDIELAVQSGWWKQANQVPPVLQGRRDIYFECEESATTNKGSRTTITREIFVLFQDYSQTVLTVRYDPYKASDVELEQRHEPPPRALRQDQMEEFHELFGRRISEGASSKKDTIVGDGTPQGLVAELLRPFKEALRPVGTRAYGAVVYSNMGNASTQQHDVIRPGDIMSVRNAKFQGKHGPMHAKYSAEVGKPDHVGVVAEWDGTKKKVRVWEQGRESKKVKLESFKLDDLRSGEVKIWRVVPRSWVGWNGQG